VRLSCQHRPPQHPEHATRWHNQIEFIEGQPTTASPPVRLCDTDHLDDRVPRRRPGDESDRAGGTRLTGHIPQGLMAHEG